MNRDRSTNRRGAAALEFALWLPILVTIVAGTIDPGWFLWMQHTAILAAREGVRAGANQTHAMTGTGTATEADIETAARNQALLVLAEAHVTDGVTPTVTAVWATDAVTGWELLTLTVELPVEPLLGLVPAWGNSVTAQFKVMTQVQI